MAQTKTDTNTKKEPKSSSKPPQDPTQPPDPGTAPGSPTKASKNWRKAITSVKTLVSPTTSTRDRSRSASRLGRRRTILPSLLSAQAATFTRRLTQAVSDPRTGWPSRQHGGSRYRRVKVLLTYWAETDDPAFGANRAARKLAQVFQDRYGFDALVWLIPVLQPQKALAAKLRQFARDDVGLEGPGEDLLIFWYGGSAREESRGGPVVWYGESSDGPTINSQIVPQILGASQADVLTIYDSPHALHGSNTTGPGLCEHLGAAAHDGYVAGFGDSGEDSGGASQSFTRALIRILDTPDRAVRGISVVDVHRKLVNRYHVATSAPTEQKMTGRASGDSWSSESKEEKQKRKNRRQRVFGEEAYLITRPWLPDALRQTPVYVHLSRCRPRIEAGPAASIVLGRLEWLGHTPAEVALMQLEGIAQAQNVHQASTNDGNEKGDESDDEGTVEVTVRMRLRAPPMEGARLGRWRDWILDAPPEARRLVSVVAKPLETNSKKTNA
ncbi:hypothetical protein PG989_010704 [Apiospora arundinis]